MNRVIVIAPHPDDETLGCGGTILRHIARGDEVHWLIVTSMTEEAGYSLDEIDNRAKTISEVSRLYKFTSTIELGYQTGALESLPRSNIIQSLGSIFKAINPDTLYIPFPGDVHSDHQISYSCAEVCSKTFRCPSLMKVLTYEVPSETDFSFNPTIVGFQPNTFTDIGPYLDKKIEILNCYDTEIEDSPFPRSETSVRALATTRGSMVGRVAAEAFMTLRDIS